MSKLNQYSYRRQALYQTYSTRDADKRDLIICKQALNQLDKVDKSNIKEMAAELSEIEGIGPNSALRLLGAVGRCLAKNPSYIQARIAGKVRPNGS